jgi:hypothetical protein
VLRFGAGAYTLEPQTQHCQTPNLSRSRVSISNPCGSKFWRIPYLRNAFRSSAWAPKIGGIEKEAMARPGSSLDAARAALGEPPCPDPAHLLPNNPSLTRLAASCPLCRVLVTFHPNRAPQIVPSGPSSSSSWRPPSWSLRPRKVRLKVVDKVPLAPCATAPEARILGPNVAPPDCALMTGLTWSLLTSLGRVVAGQSGDPLQGHDHMGATNRGGLPGARACGSVAVASHPGMCANGPAVHSGRPGSRARFWHIAVRTPLHPPC